MPADDEQYLIKLTVQNVNTRAQNMIPTNCLL